MRCVRARTLVPMTLATAYALWTFWPDGASMPGWGGDPLFDLWTFEHVWRQMDRLGPLHLWSDRFWSAPIFAGAPLQLAFSENQLYPALILRPLWRALGGPLALQWGALAMTLAAFGCAFGWLRSIGLRELAGAGALLFRTGLPAQWRIAALALAVVAQAPIALEYLALQRAIGSLGASLAYGAVPRSFLGTAMRPTLLQRFVPGYPTTEVPIEAAGFL